VPPPDASDLSPWLLYPIVFLFFLALASFAYWWTRREQDQREAFCERHGLTFHDLGGDVELPEALAIHRFAPMGADPEIRWSMEGERNGLRLAVGCLGFYSLASGSPQGKGYPLLFAAARNPQSVPGFHLMPRRLHHRLTGLFSKHDLDFPEDRAFSRQFRLHATDPGACRVWFTPERRAFFLEHPRLHAEGLDELLVLYQPPSMWRLTRFRPRHAKSLLDAITDLAQCGR